MSAVVTPVGVQNFELGLGWVSVFRLEIILNKQQIIKPKSKAVLLVELLQFGLIKTDKIFMNNHRSWFFLRWDF